MYPVKGHSLSRFIAIVMLTAMSVFMLAGCTPLGPKGSVTGTVTVNGDTTKPVYDAVVSVKGCKVTAKTGYDGKFTLTGVPAGKQSITIAKEGFQTQTVVANVPANGVASVDVSFAPNQGASEVDVVVAPAIAGALGMSREVEVNPTEPYLSAEVVVSLVNNSKGSTYTAGAKIAWDSATGFNGNGSIVLYGVEPGQDYTLKVYVKGKFGDYIGEGRAEGQVAVASGTQGTSVTLNVGADLNCSVAQNK